MSENNIFKYKNDRKYLNEKKDKIIKKNKKGNKYFLSNSQSFINNKNYKFSLYNSKSKNNLKSIKVSNNYKKHTIDKYNPSYLYLKELQYREELNKRKIQTSYYKRKIKLKNENNLLLFKKPDNNSWKKEIAIYNNHKQILGKINDRKNPYSIYWYNKLLEKKFNMEIGVIGFLNGYPLFDLKKRKEIKRERRKFDDNFNIINNNNIKSYNNGKENKKNKIDDKIIEHKKNERKSKEELEDNEKFYEGMDKIFNTNQKNFFKFRKDIKEGKIFYIIKFRT